jgi:hypothetical protein
MYYGAVLGRYGSQRPNEIPVQLPFKISGTIVVPSLSFDGQWYLVGSLERCLQAADFFSVASVDTTISFQGQPYFDHGHGGFGRPGAESFTITPGTPGAVRYELSPNRALFPLLLGLAIIAGAVLVSPRSLRQLLGAGCACLLYGGLEAVLSIFRVRALIKKALGHEPWEA